MSLHIRVRSPKPPAAVIADDKTICNCNVPIGKLSSNHHRGRNREARVEVEVEGGRDEGHGEPGYWPKDEAGGARADIGWEYGSFPWDASEGDGGTYGRS